MGFSKYKKIVNQQRFGDGAQGTVITEIYEEIEKPAIIELFNAAEKVTEALGNEVLNNEPF